MKGNGSYSLIIDDIVIDVERKRIKNLHLYVFPPDGKVKITAPYSVSDEKIRLFAVSKAKWIRKHRHKYSVRERPAILEYKAGETVYLWGKPYILNLIDHKGYPKVEMKNEMSIDLYAAESSTILERKEILYKWYRETLSMELPGLIEKWQAEIGVRAVQWKIRRMKTRWGTCNPAARRIWISLELVKKPKYCLEYIIVHELVHLLERNHTPRFADFMDKFLPDWKSIKAEMNRSPLKQKE